MRTLLELFFAMLFIGLFISFLPTIIGFVSLCAIVAFIFSLLKNIFSCDEGSSDKKGQSESYIKVNIETERQNKQEEQETVERKAENKGRYNVYRNYWRTYDDYEDYYDDRYHDIPPDEGDGFHGTGAPFL